MLFNTLKHGLDEVKKSHLSIGESTEGQILLPIFIGKKFRLVTKDKVVRCVEGDEVRGATRQIMFGPLSDSVTSEGSHGLLMRCA